MSDDRRIVLVLIVVVTAVVTGDPVITAAVTVVAWAGLRWWRPRRDTWDATAVHRRRMAAMRRHASTRGGAR